jgi:Protein of unknown function (DUF2786)
LGIFLSDRSWISKTVIPLGQTAYVAKTRQQQRAEKKRRDSEARKLAARNHEQTLWGEGGGPAGTAGSEFGGSGGPWLGSEHLDRKRGSGPVTSPVTSAGASRSAAHTAAELADLGEHVELLIGSGLTLSNAGSEFREHLDSIVDRLVDLDGVLASESVGSTRIAALRPEPLIAQRLVERIALLWETGWQPLDVIHVVRKERNPRVARLAGVLIHAESASFPGRSFVPDEWADQLAAIPNVDQAGFLAQEALKVWRAEEQLCVVDSIHDGLVLLGLLQVLPRLTVLCDPPSKWSVSGSEAGDRAARNQSATLAAGSSSSAAPEASAKTMATIRALLAKAEATTFEAEREAFAAKAQDLMTRHSIDAALLDQRHGEQLGAGVRKRRFHLDNPYATEKVYLLATVARLNNVKIVYEDRFAMATAVGFPTDIELTDLLFTSLLVQAAKGLQDLVAAAGKGRTSSPAFRRAYWVAYGVRIGERLAAAQTQATHEAEATYGGALVLVLKEREEAVSAVTDELFKNTKKMKVRQLDSDGWDAGRAAAGLANLGTAKARLRS